MTDLTKLSDEKLLEEYFGATIKWTMKSGNDNQEHANHMAAKAELLSRLTKQTKEEFFAPGADIDHLIEAPDTPPRPIDEILKAFDQGCPWKYNSKELRQAIARLQGERDMYSRTAHLSQERLEELLAGGDRIINALDGQASLDEANNTILKLQAQADALPGLCDALEWAITYLVTGEPKKGYIKQIARAQSTLTLTRALLAPTDTPGVES